MRQKRKHIVIVNDPKRVTSRGRAISQSAILLGNPVPSNAERTVCRERKVVRNSINGNRQDCSDEREHQFIVNLVPNMAQIRSNV